MNDEISIEKINAQDFDYCFNLFMTELNNKQYKSGKTKYYYQYEMDSAQTEYESMMSRHIIYIIAGSYEEAMIINVLLRIIIDGRTYSLLNYCSHEDENDVAVKITDFFQNIYKSKYMKEYEGYVSYKIKKILPGRNYENVASPIGFDKEKIIRIMSDSNYIGILRNNIFSERLQYLIY